MAGWLVQTHWKYKRQCLDSNPTFSTPNLEWLYMRGWDLFLFNFRGWTINTSVGKSFAVKLVTSSKASGKKKLANRLTIGSWRKSVREGAPWGSMWGVSLLLLESRLPQKQTRCEGGETGCFHDPLFWECECWLWCAEVEVTKKKEEWGFGEGGRDGRTTGQGEPQQKHQLLTRWQRQNQRESLSQSLSWGLHGKGEERRGRAGTQVRTVSLNNPSGFV